MFMVMIREVCTWPISQKVYTPVIKGSVLTLGVKAEQKSMNGILAYMLLLSRCDRLVRRVN